MLELLNDLRNYIKDRKQYWLTPVIMVLLLLGVLLVLGGGSALAPFIYSIF